MGGVSASIRTSEDAEVQHGVQSHGGEAEPAARALSESRGAGARDPSVHVVEVAEGSARWSTARSFTCHRPAAARARESAPAAVGAGACAPPDGAHTPKNSYPVLFRSKREAFAFIHAQRQALPVTRLCALCHVTRAGYYAWARRRPSAQAEQGRTLLRQIERLFRVHAGVYGSPRIVRALRAEGIATSQRRVLRLMRQAGLRARAARRGLTPARSADRSGEKRGAECCSRP